VISFSPCDIETAGSLRELRGAMTASWDKIWREIAARCLANVDLPADSAGATTDGADGEWDEFGGFDASLANWEVNWEATTAPPRATAATEAAGCVPCPTDAPASKTPPQTAGVAAGDVAKWAGVVFGLLVIGGSVALGVYRRLR